MSMKRPVASSSETHMPQNLNEQYQSELQRRCAKLPTNTPKTAVEIADAALTAAQAASASDVHFVPVENGLEMMWRIDGVLHPIERLPKELASNVVSRLKVMAELLTYRTDTPQEGRIRNSQFGSVEMRVSTFPTLFGEKAVVRLFATTDSYRHLSNLGLPAEIESRLRDLLLESGGVVVISGPAGSGKTTTIYACLRELVDKFGPQRSLVSLEDPIEAVVPGVSQSQIQAAAGFDYATGLKSLMRQDPEVILVGEIRDRLTAETVFQASLTGHLVLTTFHAGSAAGAICRLSDMGIEPYLLRTGLLGLVSQRLARRLCVCARSSTDEVDKCGLKVSNFRVPVGCDVCRGTGYQGRTLLAEFLRTQNTELGKAILSRSDADMLESLAVSAGMRTRWNYATEAIENGITSPIEVRRVLGFGHEG